MGYHPPSYYDNIPEGKRVEGFFLVNKPTKASGPDIQKTVEALARQGRLGRNLAKIFESDPTSKTGARLNG